VVVGLGPVGRRKLEGLFGSGATIRGVDPLGWEGEIHACMQMLAEPYREDHLENASLVFAAATAEVNAQVVSDCRVRKIWVNAASAPASGDFAVPASWSDGPIRLTISTSGASPAMAALLRDRAATAIGPVASGLALLLAEMRPRILADVADPRVRDRIFRAWGDPKWLDLAESRGLDVARDALIERIEAEVRGMRP
jgi:siroheme synthase-like protein